ncbi:MAG: P-loop NTPase fold protein [Gammaproteobacteria bacterium]|nr:P-loop NTPase fold protein [Gammaproteobacteria bacterium]
MNTPNRIATKIRPLEVDPDNPFDGDALDRKGLCEEWGKFIANSTTPYTLAIDARWVDGKTTMMNMLKAHLEQSGFFCVSYDAWQCDFYGDALPTLIGEIQNKTKEIEDKIDSLLIEEFKNKSQKLGKAIISREVVRSLTNVLAMVAGVPAMGDVSGIVEKILDKHNVVEQYMEYKNAVRDFKDELAKFALQIKRETGNPLVIFVDEVDRCRPNFAIEVLEKVKHFFDVESVVFVFAVNKDELVKTIKAVYGDIDGDAYLRKFFDRIVPLRNAKSLIELSDEGDNINRIHALRYAVAGHSPNSNIPSPGVFIDLFVRDYGVSLRDQEQILAMVKISLSTTEIVLHISPVLLAYFSTLKFACPELYFKSKKAMITRDVSRLPFDEYDAFHKKHLGLSVEELAKQMLSKERKLRDNATLTRLQACVHLCAIHCKTDVKYRDAVTRRAKIVTGHPSFWAQVDNMANSDTLGNDEITRYIFPGDTTIIEEIDKIGNFVDVLTNHQQK